MAVALSRRSFLGAAALGGATFLAGCAVGAKSPTGQSSGAKPTGTVTVMYESNEVTEAIIKDFETANPGVKIQLIKPDNARLLSMFAAGQAPDLFEAVGVWDAPYWAARGKLEPLDGYLSRSTFIKQADLDPVNGIWRYDGSKQGAGSYYGLCKDYSQDGTVWANKALFDKAGLALPSGDTPLTYDQLLEIGRKLTKKSGGKVETYGLGWFGSPRLLNMLPMVESAGGSLFSPDGSAIDFTSDAALEALEWYFAVGKDGLAPGPLAKSSESDDALFASGRVGVILAGYWFAGRLEKEKVGADAYMLPAPQLGSTRVSPCYYGVGMSMAKDSKNKEAAWAFMDYFIGGKPAETRAKAGWGLPALTSLTDELPQTQEFQKRALAVQKKEAEFMKVLAFTPFATNGQLQTVIDDEFAKSVTSGDVKGFATTITAKCNQLIAEGKTQVQ